MLNLPFCLGLAAAHLRMAKVETGLFIVNDDAKTLLYCVDDLKSNLLTP